MITTPTEIGTRFNSHTFKYSTDLILMSPHLGSAVKTKKGSNLGRGQLQLHIEIQVKAYLSIGKAPSWNLNDSNWDT